MTRVLRPCRCGVAPRADKGCSVRAALAHGCRRPSTSGLAARSRARLLARCLIDPAMRSSATVPVPRRDSDIATPARGSSAGTYPATPRSSKLCALPPQLIYTPTHQNRRRQPPSARDAYARARRTLSSSDVEDHLRDSTHRCAAPHRFRARQAHTVVFASQLLEMLAQSCASPGSRVRPIVDTGAHQAEVDPHTQTCPDGSSNCERGSSIDISHSQSEHRTRATRWSGAASAVPAVSCDSGVPDCAVSLCSCRRRSLRGHTYPAAAGVVMC